MVAIVHEIGRPGTVTGAHIVGDQSALAQCVLKQVGLKIAEGWPTSDAAASKEFKYTMIRPPGDPT